jgi:sterol desaturase/sphingolipid hydroxylase (fatty acid hydroxylase superfamily)
VFGRIAIRQTKADCKFAVNPSLMKFEKIHNKGQAQLFQNPYLEMLTKANPLVIWSIYLPFIIGLPVYAFSNRGFSGGKIALLFFTGMFFWTFFEYLAHQYAFHWVANSNKAQKLVYIMHGNHHHYPRDRDRLFMPPVPSIILASAIFGLEYLVLRENAFAFFPGFILGYLIYASMHYAIHAWNPPFKWMKPLWRNHHLHHYKDEHKGFGVSSTLWDLVFGTMFDLKKEKEDKQKVQELMFTARSSKREETGAAH